MGGGEVQTDRLKRNFILATVPQLSAHLLKLCFALPAFDAQDVGHTVKKMTTVQQSCSGRMSLISIALKGFVYINRCERCFIWLNICFAGDISSTSKRSTWLVVIIKEKSRLSKNSFGKHKSSLKFGSTLYD